MSLYTTNGKNTDVMELIDEPEPLIPQRTKDYAMFKKIPGNRDINDYPSHIANMTKKILKRNKLYVHEIIVNRNMGVVDGQNRLEVAKNNNLWIYYKIDPYADIKDVRDFNSNHLNWSRFSWMKSYAEEGYSSYKIALEYVTKYKISPSNVAGVLSNWQSGSMGIFRSGNFVIVNQEKADIFFEAYKRTQPIVGQRIWADREFVHALYIAADHVSIDELMLALQVQGERIPYSYKVKDYLREFERILNFRRRTSQIKLV